MYILKITDDNEFLNICTNYENDDIGGTYHSGRDDKNDVIFKYLLLPIPSSILLFSLISLMIYTLIKHLITNK